MVVKLISISYASLCVSENSVCYKAALLWKNDE